MSIVATQPVYVHVATSNEEKRSNAGNEPDVQELETRGFRSCLINLCKQRCQDQQSGEGDHNSVVEVIDTKMEREATNKYHQKCGRVRIK